MLLTFLMRLTAATVIVVAMESAAQAAQPSFDCQRAAAPIEHLICGSDKLSDLDSKLAATFRARREGLSEEDRAPLLQEQRRWLTGRLASCGIPSKGDLAPDAAAKAATCLGALYDARIAAVGTPQPAPAAPVQAAAATPAPATAPIAAPTPLPQTPVPAPAAPAPTAPAPKLAESLFPAQGPHETTVAIPTFGRYAFTVKSDQGTALQLVDRMAGPGVAQGAAGSADGRVDAFLDRGIYKLRLISDPHGSGDAELSAKPSTELETAPLRLVEQKPVLSDLGDHEQRSYWLEIPQRRTVAIEAAGRYLGDLRLWKDGVWLVDATPSLSERDPGNGQPLAVRQLSAKLEPGLYKLTAYGGAGQKWAEASNAKPFMLRWGIPTLPTVGRALHEASATGVDHWLVPRKADYFRIDTDKAEHTTLTVSPYDPEHPFFSNGDHAAIEKNSRDPMADLAENAGDDGFWLVTVERTPGARYRLTTLDSEESDAVSVGNGGGAYFVGLQRGGIGDDQPDPTAVVIKDGKEVVAASAIPVAADKPWQRRFNLLEPVALILHAPAAMALKVSGTGADADYRVQPLLVGPAGNSVKPPAAKVSGTVWQVEAGYSVLTITPRENGKGVLTLTLGSEGSAAPATMSPRLAAIGIPSITFAAKSRYVLQAGRSTDSHIGVIVRKLPLDLAEALSVELAPGQDLSLPITAAAAGRLQAVREDGLPFAVALDGQPASVGPALTAGKHSVTLSLTGDRPAYVSLQFLADDMRAEAPLPALAAGKTTPPTLPSLTAGTPTFLDLAKSQSVTYAIPVDGPALYRLESQGLIETSGALRTRTLPALAEDHANGVGRNFLLQQYLGDGDYQVTVTAAGASHGRIGLSLAKTPVIDHGALDLGLASRLTLKPGEAAAYGFHIAETGDYDLTTVGLGRTFAMRLDDADGWPMLAPGSEADVSINLRPGDYRLILLPQALESRAVTLLEREPAAVERRGHGPFPATFDEDLANRWMEPDEGKPRAPDVWRFTLPAPTTLTMAIDRGMRAVLKGSDGTERVATEAAAWSGALPQGDYSIEVMSEAPNSRVDYTLHLATADLVAGESRALTAPGRLSVAIGNSRQVELSSDGAAPVRASLIDAAGHTVATNDGRDNDWNFAISGSFAPGLYGLQVDPVGAATAATTVSFTQPTEIADKPAVPGQPMILADGAIHVVPLDGGKPDSLLVVAADGSVPTGLALEAKVGDGWQRLAGTSGLHPTLAVPRGDKADAAYRVRVWTVDHGKQPVTLIVETVVPAEFGESALAAGDGIALAPLKLGTETLGIGRVKLDRPGILGLRAGTETLRWSSAAETALDRDESGALIATGTSLWLLDRTPHKLSAARIDPAAQAAHLTLQPGPAVTLPIATADGPTLWRLEGLDGQPGIAVADGTAATLPMAVGPDSPTRALAFGFAPAGLAHPVLKLWRADGDATDLPVMLDRLSFSKPRELDPGLGLTDGTLAAMEAVAVKLPAGPKRLILTLPPGTAALLQKAGTPGRLLWSADAGTQVIETEDDQLLLLHTVKDPAPFTLSIEPRGEEKPLVLGPGAVLTRFSPTPGVLHLTVAPDAPGSAMVRAAGSAEGMTIVGSDGKVARGKAVPAGAGALIDLAYKPGQMAIGLDAPAVELKPDTTLTLPASLALKGPQMTVRVPAGPARLVHVETDAPVLLRSHGTAGQPVLFEAGASLNLVMGQDQPTDLQILATGSAPLSGTARFEAVAATPITDGLGPKRRVAPGQSRLFSFTLKDARTVGVGARASVDIVTTRLLTAAGEELSRGLVAMKSLKPGTYLLAVDVPADGAAVDIEPALVGVTLPGNGPPDDVKADYAALVGAKP